MRGAIGAGRQRVDLVAGLPGALIAADAIGQGRRMRRRRERVAGIAGLRIAAVRRAGDLRRVESNRHQRNAATCPVLAGVESLAAQGVRDQVRMAMVKVLARSPLKAPETGVQRRRDFGDEGLALEIQPAHRATMRIERGRHIDWAGSVIAAEGDLRQRDVVVAAAATAASAARNCSGRALPLFSARRRIPAQALGLK